MNLKKVGERTERIKVTARIWLDIEVWKWTNMRAQNSNIGVYLVKALISLHSLKCSEGTTTSTLN